MGLLSKEIIFSYESNLIEKYCKNENGGVASPETYPLCFKFSLFLQANSIETVVTKLMRRAIDTQGQKLLT